VTIAIYCIQHKESGRRYVGKSINVERRLTHHKHTLTSATKSKDVNRHLRKAVQLYGWGAFTTTHLEVFDHVDEVRIAERELYWIDFYRTTERLYGYNIRRDSSTAMIVHEETRALQRLKVGSANPNYGNNWSEEQRARMSDIAVLRHASGKYYGESWRENQRTLSTRAMSDPLVRAKIAASLKIAKRKYNFFQYTRDGKFVDAFHSVDRILELNPSYKWQNIYSVCNDYKPTYMGCIWRKKLKTIDLDL
jgi:group I intron endonuclease